VRREHDPNGHGPADADKTNQKEGLHRLCPVCRRLLLAGRCTIVMSGRKDQRKRPTIARSSAALLY
jgi:hypothetical protein